MGVTSKTIEIPATQRTIAESVTCDLCGTAFDSAQPEPAEVNWGKSCHDINRTAVSISKGYGYADCGYFASRAYHVCPGCFQKKLEPWLQSQGARSTESDVDW